MDHLSKFHLNRTVNELGNAILRTPANQKKVVAPSAQKWKVTPSGTVLPPGGPCCAKSTKNSIFREPEHPSQL